MLFEILNSTVIPGPRVDRRQWWLKLWHWLIRRKPMPLHHVKFAHFAVQSLNGLFASQLVLLNCGKSAVTWYVTHIDTKEQSFHAKLIEPIPLNELKKFNNLKNAHGVAYANVFIESQS